jgi:hypothetical protein
LFQVISFQVIKTRGLENDVAARSRSMPFRVVITIQNIQINPLYFVWRITKVSGESLRKYTGWFTNGFAALWLSAPFHVVIW